MLSLCLSLFNNRRGLLYATASSCNMESLELGEMNRMSDQALTWSKDVVGQLNKQYRPGLENVELRDLNRLT